MIPRLLFLDNARCRVPTDHTSLNSRDEVYFLVAGATSGGRQIRVAPDPNHDDVDYYPLSSGQSLGNIVLAQADMKEGDSLAFTVAMCDQDNAQLDAISDAIQGAIYGALAFVTEGATAPLAVEKFVQSGVELVNSVTKSGDQVIAAFGVNVTIDHGNIRAQWIPMQSVGLTSAGDVKCKMTANGGDSNYDLSFLVVDASQLQVGGGLMGKQSGSFKHVSLSVISNGTNVLPATVLEASDDSLLVQTWEQGTSGEFTEKSRVKGQPATALATTAGGVGLVAAVQDKDGGKLKAILWGVDYNDKLTWQDAARLDTASAFAITGIGSLIMRRLAVAAIGVGNDLQISVWDKVLPSGSQTYELKRLGDNGTDTVKATRVAIAPWSKGVVTAIQQHGSNHLQLIAWHVDDKGNVTRKGASHATDAEIDQVAIVNTDLDRENIGNRLVTAVRESDKVLKVMVWDVAYDGTKFFRRDTDSSPAPAHVADLALAPMGPLAEIDKTLVAAQVATAAVRLQGGKLRLCLWNISKNGRLSRAYDNDFAVVKEVSMDFWKIGTNTVGPPTPESIVVAAAAMADNSLGLFQFRASVNTIISG
jgi:hypothetical protein